MTTQRRKLKIHINRLMLTADRGACCIFTQLISVQLSVCQISPCVAVQKQHYGISPILPLHSCNMLLLFHLGFNRHFCKSTLNGSSTTKVNSSAYITPQTSELFVSVTRWAGNVFRNWPVTSQAEVQWVLFLNDENVLWIQHFNVLLRLTGDDISFML